MTKQEFVAGYMRRSDMPADALTEDGFRIGDRHFLALPCACGDEGCQGWAMVSEDRVARHERFDAPST